MKNALLFILLTASFSSFSQTLDLRLSSTKWTLLLHIDSSEYSLYSIGNLIETGYVLLESGIVLKQRNGFKLISADPISKYSLIEMRLKKAEQKKQIRLLH